MLITSFQYARLIEHQKPSVWDMGIVCILLPLARDRGMKGTVKKWDRHTDPPKDPLHATALTCKWNQDKETYTQVALRFTSDEYVLKRATTILLLCHNST